jgi:hypothetical protein
MFLPKTFLKNKFHRNSKNLTNFFPKRVANLVKLTLQIHIFPKAFPIFCPRKDKISGKKITEGDQLEQLQK